MTSRRYGSRFIDNGRKNKKIIFLILVFSALIIISISSFYRKTQITTQASTQIPFPSIEIGFDYKLDTIDEFLVCRNKKEGLYSQNNNCYFCFGGKSNNSSSKGWGDKYKKCEDIKEIRRLEKVFCCNNGTLVSQEVVPDQNF